MSVENLKTEKTALQLAEEEIAKEKKDKAVLMLKEKLRERDKAKLMLENIEREIQDLNEQIKQGDI